MEKENKYNNALEKLQEALAPKDGCEISGLTRDCIEEIFPELKESEDERIRKELIRYFKGMNFVTQEGAEKVTRWIAWLEKQGEKPQGESALEAIKEEQVDNANKIEQNPAWSEEDKNFMYDTLSNLTELKDRYGEEYGNVGRCIAWLKSIKGRVQPQPKQEWSEEDEKIALSIEQVMNCASLLNIVPQKIDKVRTWLKSIKERIGG